MINDPSPSIPSDEKKQSDPTLEEQVAGAVQQWLQGHPPRRRPSSTEFEGAIHHLTQKLCASASQTTPAELEEMVRFELRHQTQRATESKETCTHRIRTMANFLEEDLRTALHSGVEKGAESGIRELHQLHTIAEETSLEIHQMLTHAKKEFSTGDVDNPVVREAVLCKVQALEEETTTESVAKQLAKGLGIQFVAHVRRKLQHAETPEAIGALLEGAAHQALQQFPLPAIQALVLEDLRQLRLAFLEK